MKQQNITQDSTEEHWKTAQFIKSDGAVEIYSNYMVSDRGRIGSLTDSHGNKRKVMKIRKPCQCGTSLEYLQVGLLVKGKRYKRSVHRLVLSSFHPELYFSGAEVDHINRDPADNYLVNLRWTDKNSNKANRSRGALKPIRVTYLNGNHTEEFDNMYECDRAFGMYLGWCNYIIHQKNGFHAKLNILIEKI